MEEEEKKFDEVEPKWVDVEPRKEYNKKNQEDDDDEEDDDGESLQNDQDVLGSDAE